MITDKDREIFHRTILLTGEDVFERITEAKVIVIGVGGVGSWCAESLVRSGVRHLTIVDADKVSVTNCNRQMMARPSTVGRVKVEVLKEMLLEINPDAEITALEKVYSEDTAAEFGLDSYDYVIDAVDSLKDKANLILEACRTRAVFFSSMGAALKMDPTGIRVDEFWKVQGCPLAATLRRRFRKEGTFPSRKFLCVFDPEVLPNRGGRSDDQSMFRKASINGSVAHMTSMFGLTIAGLVINDIYKKTIAG